MKIYTRTGDSGQTSLLHGVRVKKDDRRLEAIGEVDHVNATIGYAIASMRAAQTQRYDDLSKLLTTIQRELFDVGRELATPADRADRLYVSEDHIRRLEQTIDRLESELPPLTSFILPGGGIVGAALHVTRTATRTAERRVSSLADQEPVGTALLAYMNRLSDLLFVAARVANAREQIDENRVVF